MPNVDSALARARALLADLQLDTEPVIAEAGGALRPGALVDSSFICRQRLAAIENDLRNLCVSAAKARNEREMLFMHDLAVREDARLTSAQTLVRSLCSDRAVGLSSCDPDARCELRTTFLSRLAQYGTPGQVVLSLWFESRVAARVALAGDLVAGDDDTTLVDIPIVFDRLNGRWEAFEEQMLASVATDLVVPGTEEALRRAGIWTAHYEATAANAYREGGLRDG
jgi:hypothetical protein